MKFAGNRTVGAKEGKEKETRKEKEKLSFHFVIRS